MDWLADQLGMARDWDVLAYATLPMVIKKLPAAGFLGGIAEVIETQAESLRRTFSVLIESPRFTRWMLNFSRWQLAFPDQPQQALKTQPERKFSPEIYSRRMLKKFHHRLQVRGARLAGKNPDPRAAHRLRIASKKMRYATEFFLSFYPPKKLGYELPRLLCLQDQLGMHNDLIVAAKLLDTLRQTHASFCGSIDFLQGFLAACASGREKKMRKQWKNFKPMKFFL
jgi:CHAD domain-containing protein